MLPVIPFDQHDDRKLKHLQILNSLEPTCSMRLLTFPGDVGKVVSFLQLLFVVPFAPYNIHFGQYCDNIIICRATTFTKARVILQVSTTFTNGAGLQLNAIDTSYNSTEQLSYARFNLSQFTNIFATSLEESKFTCIVEYSATVDSVTIINERLGINIVNDNSGYQWSRPINPNDYAARKSIRFTTLPKCQVLPTIVLQKKSGTNLGMPISILGLIIIISRNRL